MGLFRYQIENDNARRTAVVASAAMTTTAAATPAEVGIDDEGARKTAFISMRAVGMRSSTGSPTLAGPAEAEKSNDETVSVM